MSQTEATIHHFPIERARPSLRSLFAQLREALVASLKSGEWSEGPHQISAQDLLEIIPTSTECFRTSFEHQSHLATHLSILGMHVIQIGDWRTRQVLPLLIALQCVRQKAGEPEQARLLRLPA